MGATLGAGATFAGYTIERQLGVGGMGEVYLARDRDLPRPVALKLLTRTAAGDPDVRQRFLREAYTVARLNHPNIVTIYARGEEHDRPWIAMTYVDGSDVADVLRHGPLELHRAVRILSDTADALDYAHQRGILHRDVKPANILVTGTSRERVMLTDFGIAKALDESTTLTRTGEIFLSFQYAAPERIDTSTPVDHRADVYSLGCTLYHMLTGEPPYPGDSVPQVIHGHLSAPIPRPSHTNPALPVAFDDVIARALAKKPADRYGSCGHLAAAVVQASTRAHPATTVVASHNSASTPHEITTGAPTWTGTPATETEEWYRRAIAAGDTNAMNGLGVLLKQRGDLHEAENWYRRAIAAGDTNAMNNLAVLLKQRGDLQEAENWYRKAIAAGNADSMNNLGNLFRARGDLHEAENWYRKAIDTSNANAMHNLAVLLKQRGELREAENWYRKAIAAGDLGAMNGLGVLLEQRGELREAENWYRKAAAAGNTRAVNNLQNMLRQR